MTTCKFCNSKVLKNYCANCGQPVALKKINGHYIIHEIEHVLHFEKGILYTLRELLIRPGESIRRFILEDRSRLVKPVIFIIITSLVYTILAHYFEVSAKTNPGIASDTSYAKIMKWTQDHMGYANLIMGALIAFFIRIFFRKREFNYFEIIILLCFAMGMGMLIFSIFVLAEGITSRDLQTPAAVAGIGYTAWAVARFYGGKSVWTYVKSFLAYIIGMMSYSALALVLGTLIDIIFRVN